jgi:hypothetical protein
MSRSSEPTACVHNLASSEEDMICDWCQSILDYSPTIGWFVPLLPAEHEYAISLFGGPTVTSRRRWKSLSESMLETKHVEWARLPYERDPVEYAPCTEHELTMLSEAVARGDELTQSQEHILSEGILFHDGSKLQYIDQTLFLNGVSLSQMKLTSILPILCDPQLRKGWNLPSLLLGLSSCSPLNNMDNYQYRFGPRETMATPYRPLAGMLDWLSKRVRVDRSLVEKKHAYHGYLSWAHDINQRIVTTQRRRLYASFRDALVNHPQGLFETYKRPWMEEWQELQEAEQAPEILNWALKTDGKHVCLRVRTKSGNTRAIKVPTHPMHWAYLISLALSPLNSAPGKLLLGIQHNWSVPYSAKEEPSRPLVKSLEFCHQIVNGLPDHIHVEHATMLAVGKLGHFYQVKVGTGQHGAPYTIEHIRRLDHHRHESICIHSGSHNTRLPLGDVLGGVLLSMVNDTTASEKIPSLGEILAQHTPFGFPAASPPRHWVEALDQEALTHLKHIAHPYYPAWYRNDEREYDEMQEDHDLPRNARGIALRGLINRNFGAGRQGVAVESSWVERFTQSFDVHGHFPYEEVVEAWRGTVRPYNPDTNPMRRNHPGRLYERRLHRHLHRMMPHRRQGDVHEAGNIRDGERRWGQVYARVWEVLLRQPIGSTIHVPTVSGEALSFEHAGLRVSVRDGRERRFVNRIARVLGYVRSEERDGYHVHTRRDHPRPDARLQLSTWLNELQKQQGVRNAPPRWWDYINIIAAPNALENLNWQLHVDLTDLRQVEQSGLGELLVNRYDE